MATLSPRRFTSREYYRMAEAGVLQPDARVELLGGQIFNMSPIGPSHGSAVKRLIDAFGIQSQGRWLICAQDALALDDFSEPQPDLMLLKRTPDFYSSNHPGPDDVFLLIEVSDSTLDFDREEKLPLYGRAGIPEFWVVNIPEEIVEIYRQPHYGGYNSTEILHPGASAHPSAFPDVAIDVASLLSRGLT